MPAPNVILTPDTLDKQLGDLRRQILALSTAGATAQTRPYSESVDAAHPFYLDFVMAKGIQPAIAKLSFKFRLYRSTSSFAGGNTGGQSAGHTHGSAAHSHTITLVHTVVAATLSLSAGPTITDNSGNTAGGPVAVSGDSTTPGSTGGGSVDHTHSVGASSLGVTEGSSTTIATLLVDGVDKTSVLGGPWGVDTVGLDVAKVLPLGDGLWHTIQLTPVAQGRLVVEFSYV